MSRPGFLERLLDGAGVEWRALGEIVTLEYGKALSSSERIATGLYPVYGANGITANTNKYYHKGPSLIIGRVGSAGALTLVKKPFWPLPVCYFVRLNNDAVNLFFLYYYLDGLDLSELVRGAIPNINRKDAYNLTVPIPCPENPEKSLRIQGEIVRILDKFTELTKELTKELTGRGKQYEYYRNKLLTFHDVEWKALGDVVKVQRGKRLIKSQLEKSGNYAVYQNSMTPLGYYHESNVKSDTTFVISAGAAGEIGYSDVDFWAADDVYVLRNPDATLSKFLYYYLLKEQNRILAQVRRASIPRLSRIVIEKLQIPIPPLAEQARIVSILDKFDVLVNSISEGLPREIELRQKQYEYYRNLLLDFPGPGAVA